jgi:hypothetical protein
MFILKFDLKFSKRGLSNLPIEDKKIIYDVKQQLFLLQHTKAINNMERKCIYSSVAVRASRYRRRQWHLGRCIESMALDFVFSFFSRRFVNVKKGLLPLTFAGGARAFCALA